MKVRVLPRNSIFKAGSKKIFADYCQLWEECIDWQDALYYFLATGLIHHECLECEGLVEFTHEGRLKQKSPIP
jgi:hypothetical protein